MTTIRTLLEEHRDAVADFAACATSVPSTRWLVPRAEGKWTPAEETRHVILTYEAIVADLRDGRRMAARTSGLQRLIWRAIGLGSILYRRRIPRPVRAPRETRPPQELGTREDLLREMMAVVATFEQVYARTWEDTPRRRLFHPFFGNVSLRQAMTIAIVHTRHHAAFLRAVAGSR